MAKTLGRRCTNIIHMLCVCWEGYFGLEFNSIGDWLIIFIEVKIMWWYGQKKVKVRHAWREKSDDKAKIDQTLGECPVFDDWMRRLPDDKPLLIPQIIT